MRSLKLGCLVVVLAACGGAGEEAPPADTTAAAPAAPTASLSAIAGRWRVTAYNEATGDSVVSYELNATADTAGWTITLPNRPPIPVRVTAMGAEVTTESGPYESVLRAGVQVQTTGTARLEGDSLLGTTIARYTPPGADSVLRLRFVGKRMP